MKYVMLSLLLFSCVAFAEDAGESLVQKLNSIKTLRAQFTQVINAKHKKLTNSKGKMLIKRPLRFRFETNDPSQILTANGKEVYIYDKDLEQVTIKPQAKALRGTPALFLSESNDNLRQDFVINKENKRDNEIYHLRAKSSQPTFTKMDLIFKGPVLQGILLEDQLGQITELTLKDVQQNQTIRDTAFQFKAPRGIDVIRE